MLLLKYIFFILFNGQTSLANRNAVSCGTAQQGICFRFPKCRNAVNAPEVNILLRFIKLPCAARSAMVP